MTDYKKLRDVEWSNLRRAAEKKLATFKANQEKPLDQAQSVVFTQAEEIVLDLLGKGKLFFSYNPSVRMLTISIMGTMLKGFKSTTVTLIPCS